MKFKKLKLAAVAIALMASGTSNALLPYTAQVTRNQGFFGSPYFGISGGGYPAWIMNPSSVWYPISTAMIDIGGNTVTAISELQAALTGQQATIAGAASKSNIDAMKQLAKVDAAKVAEIPPSACSQRVISAQNTAFENNTTLQANALSQGAITKMRGGRGGGGSGNIKSRDLVQNVDATYCDPATNPNCLRTGPAKTSPGSDLRDAHLKVSTLLNGAAKVDASNPAGDEKLTFAESDKNLRDAATAYIDTVMGGTDTPRMLSKEEFGTAAGQEYEALRIVYMAKVNAAQYAFDRLYASRLPLKGSKEMVNQLKFATKDAGFIDRILTRLGSMGAGDVSEAEIKKLNVTMRTGNAKWYETVQGMDQTALMKEQVFILGNIQAMMYDMYRANELQMIQSAEQTLEAVKSNLKPKLDQAESAVGAQLKK